MLNRTYLQIIKVISVFIRLKCWGRIPLLSVHQFFFFFFSLLNDFRYNLKYIDFLRKKNTRIRKGGNVLFPVSTDEVTLDRSSLWLIRVP